VISFQQDDSDSSEDDLPVSHFAPAATAAVESTAKQRNYRWGKKNFLQKNTVFLGREPAPPADMGVKTPLQYFQIFLTDNMLENLCEHTNLYSMQRTGKSMLTTKKEIEMMIGMYLRMGLVKMSGVRQYWEAGTAYQPVCGVMSRNRFKQLLSNLHSIDNMNVTDAEKKGQALENQAMGITDTRKLSCCHT
jgi:hypothetical protein